MCIHKRLLVHYLCTHEMNKDTSLSWQAIAWPSPMHGWSSTEVLTKSHFSCLVNFWMLFVGYGKQDVSAYIIMLWDMPLMFFTQYWQEWNWSVTTRSSATSGVGNRGCIGHFLCCWDLTWTDWKIIISSILIGRKCWLHRKLV